MSLKQKRQTTIKSGRLVKKKQGSNEDKYHTVRLHLVIPHFQTVKRKKKRSVDSSKWENVMEEEKYRLYPCPSPCCSSKFSIILQNCFGESIYKNSRAVIFQKKTLKFPETLYLFLSTLNCQNLKALQDILIPTYKFYLNIFENEQADNRYSLLSPLGSWSYKTMKILETEVGYVNKKSQYSLYGTNST